MIVFKSFCDASLFVCVCVCVCVCVRARVCMYVDVLGMKQYYTVRGYIVIFTTAV